eukprot:TRINITY_DN3686_c1_g3_i1.p5 TRINITY_DN3686_c1_g3~~TRINITY_DN3686_c1_g3_i1.p5  ORF type:complete len:222 (+),score=62.14 TRINITY_DN3686_c1_g3_i1:890-1555(+)
MFSIWDHARSDDDGAGTCGSGYDPALAPNATWCGKYHAFPVSTTCRRHCLDCGKNRGSGGWHNSTGTACGGQNITIAHGDAVRTRIHQIDGNATYRWPETPGVVYRGSIWRAEVQVVSKDGVAGPPIAIGTQFFEGVVGGGITSFGAFHEHLGCVPCDAFYESEVRRGPFEGGAHPRPPATISHHNKTHPGCQNFAVAVDNARHQAQFFTGPGVPGVEGSA